MELEFDEYGYICPATRVRIAAEDIRANFVEHPRFSQSRTRKKIFDGFSRYRSDLRDLLEHDGFEWIGGSFTTAKLDPNDIDVVNGICIRDGDKNIGPFTVHGGSKMRYNVDGYVFPVYEKDDPQYETVTKKWALYWSLCFMRSRVHLDGKRKRRGILEVAL